MEPKSSNASDRAFTSTLPPLPVPNVFARIEPPPVSTSESKSVNTFPPAPAPGAFETVPAAMPVKSPVPRWLINASCARTTTSPPSPPPNVVAEIRAPSKMRSRPAVTSTLPPSPPSPGDTLSAEIFDSNTRPPSSKISSARTVTLPPRPPRPFDEVFAEICPPSKRCTVPASTNTFPPGPRFTGESAAMPVKNSLPPREISMSPMSSFTSPHAPRPSVFVEISPPSVMRRRSA